MPWLEDENTKLDIKISTIDTPSKEELLERGGHSAAICYTEHPWNVICLEDEKKTVSRIDRTLENKHHSVYEHRSVSLYLENIPKALAMVLNNEPPYATSEKSARYTEMQNIPPLEEEKYMKWRDILEQSIYNEYPTLDSKKIPKLAMENARYMLSVFTPTQMEYTVDVRQLNYLTRWMQEYILETPEKSTYVERMKRSMSAFLMSDVIKDLTVGKMEPRKIRKISLFSDVIPQKEIFDYVYQTSYYGSFAQLAQAQRHRTISYKFALPQEPKRFYIPPIIREEESLVKEWERDIQEVSPYWPQGTMVNISEKGELDYFVLKCYERLCGHAQLEIMEQTRKTLQKYIGNTEDENIRRFLHQYNKGPQCTFPKGECSSPCFFKSKALERKI